MSLPEMYTLDVDKDNKIYFEVSGKKDGIPVFFVHGGPGGHCRSEHHSLFNPEIFKSVIFDQRGCGKSTPYRSLIGNNTENLVEDIEKIRDFLKVKKFIIIGGSWGATLALKYALKYPKNILAILLRSVFLGTMNEIDWAFINGPKIFAPKLFESFSKTADNAEDLISKYYDEICVKNSKIHSWIWHDYERILSQINPDNSIFEEKKKIEERVGLPNSPFMELHYIKNNFFLKPNQLLKHKKKLSNIKIFIIQSDYDLLCPPQTSFNLASGLSNCKVVRIENAGHYISDPGVKEMMKQLLDEYEKI